MPVWLPNPPDGTSIALGLDPSDSDDWTALRAETSDGFQFTPRFGPDGIAAIWDPEMQPGGRIPRRAVAAAIAECFERWHVSRLYVDPHEYHTEVDEWALRHGEKRVIAWPTNQPRRAFAAIRRFEIDLREGRITHDGCPITEVHMRNAHKAIRAERIDGKATYLLAKPEPHQKIDAAMSSILAHEAAMDTAAADEWTPPAAADTRMWCW